MGRPRVVILRAAGTNCDRETAFAFEEVGAKTDSVHINQLVRGEKELNNYQILAIPGGFTYGDDIASGKLLANELRYKLEDEVKRFISSGKLIIGICNGFQVLVKAGLLPNLNSGFQIEATLTLNNSARFEDRWVYLKRMHSRCIWTKDLPDDIIYLPVAHGEGRFIARDETLLRLLDSEGLIAFKYSDKEGNSAGYPANPNGSIEDIAGICDQTGRIFGLMPHPERHIHYTQHPRWTRLRSFCDSENIGFGGQASLRGLRNLKEGDGLAIFRNGVIYAKKML
ncbi:MAG: phosphoribosylformylglycinamidine synthase I [Candidatus Omnitrophica bacterium]|nr:phosphoribosylformylglycinamidine synthase I [Candidatus Omnitrophota bacterium]